MNADSIHRSTRIRASLVFAALAVSACGTSEVPNPDTLTVAAREACQVRSWIAGSTEMCNGALIYRDYVYDDFGADAGLISPSPTLLNVTNRGGHLGIPLANTPSLLAPSAGDAGYPKGLENTADLVTLTLSIEGQELRVEFELNTMFNADDTLAAIAIDTDNDPATGGGAWTPLKTSSRGWELLQVFDHGDPDSNRISGRIPLPEGETWRVQAALAQRDGTVMNVAFRGVDEQAKAGKIPDQILPGSGNFWEDRQAAALKSGDISEFGHVLDVADLRNRISRAPAPVTQGFHQRVYVSDYTLGEGIARQGIAGRHGDTHLPCEQYFHYLGRYQPYGIYLPQASAQGTVPGVQIVMHGCEANHASQINEPNMQAQFGDGLNRILVSPLGRGPYGFFSDISERDVLDVLDDVQNHYATDPARVFASGYSMGGYGAIRLAALYPDRFAGLVSWVGFTGDITNAPLPGNPLPEILRGLGSASQIPNLANGASIGAAENIIDFIGNLRHVPGAYVYAGADELVQVTTSLALAQRLGQSDSPFQFFLHPVAEHLTFMLLDQWQKEADYTRDLVRVENPTRVTYRTDLAFDFPEYNIAHDRAYWISQIRAQGAGISDVDLTAPGCGGSQWMLEKGQDAGLQPLPWVSTLQRISSSAPVPARAALEGTLANVQSLTLDADATCLRGQAIAYRIQSDAPARISLSDGRALDLLAGENQGTF
ncbi:alpha/beta hydrolase [Sinimarinibacterium sp. NLF-5-8]|uniref:alpha/beta hydrolase n=1 Tax=Sinimarinibacterium sp. NLF-5-8 TaxID=2698684 RepID=UPI00137BC7F1|nr:alpha/beta hydrolase [Sinimarinibacterium sp. NLF-5-8]QHS09336.1 alpha/beta hydrolase [Sinimarinibacterium sp. NLF-5-8]